MGFQVDRFIKRFFGFLRSSEGTSYFILNKRNRQMGFQVDGDRQKGSRIPLVGGRQMGPRFLHVG